MTPILAIVFFFLVFWIFMKDSPTICPRLSTHKYADAAAIQPHFLSLSYLFVQVFVKFPFLPCVTEEENLTGVCTYTAQRFDMLFRETTQYR